MIWVKLCAMTNADDAVAAAEAGADAIGMIFAPSKRRVSLAQAKEIARALPDSIDKVGVFVNEPETSIERVAGEVGLTAVQLHGDESAAFAHGLFRGGERRSRIRVIKTIHMSGGGLPLGCEDFFRAGIVDGVLLDAVAPHPVSEEVARGGTGQTFDWKQAAESVRVLKPTSRLIVAGGLTPENVAGAIAALGPWGVDVCSGVEREAGKKDPEKMRIFVAAAKAAGNGSSI
jgi:phosphoribosylanthranilate isomerase